MLATWAAMSYPDISAIILDASFDDLVPLALKVMPDSWSECSSRACSGGRVARTGLFRLGLVQWTGTFRLGKVFISASLTVPPGVLVTRTVRQHLNLNNSEQLCR